MEVKPRSRMERMLAFTARYGLATTARYDEHYYDGNQDVRKAEVSKAVREGYLRSFPLCGNQKYYAIGPQAQKRYSLKNAVGTKGYGPAVLPKQLAIFDYCTTPTLLQQRLLLTRAEFTASFPELAEGLETLRDRYVFEVNDAGQPYRLITFVVDAGVKLRTLTSKLHTLIKRRHRNRAFRTLMDEGAFRVVLLTHCESRRNAIQKALQTPNNVRQRALAEVQISSLLAEVIGNVAAN